MAVPTVSEDDLYRSTSQCKRWFFTADQLAEQRRQTNALAAERVRTALKAAATASGSSQSEIDCLAPEEELTFVNFYCGRLLDLSDHEKFPTNVKCTAAQYFRRFYLSNSPMTYHPKDIVLSSLFLATKTENHYTPLKTFAAAVSKTPDAVLATEFLLLQSLHFTLEIRQPNRGLEGGIMELLSLVNNDTSLLLSQSSQASTPAPTPPASTPDTLDLTPLLHALEPDRNRLKNRVKRAHGAAKEILKSPALLTDAYFSYTPSQIWLAALRMADPSLATFYLTLKVAPLDPSIRIRVETAIVDCAVLMSAASQGEGKAGQDEAKRIDKKLFRCAHPETKDLGQLNARAKRTGGTTESAEKEAVEKAAKKRKLEKERREKEEDPFGPPLG
ncbi:MAG: hypothetical protein M1814_006207 [Vezdaea aestivalis]|nr:MAG: hypothetical protein M1814_006207 [Vezdaea aestivalis]